MSSCTTRLRNRLRSQVSVSAVVCVCVCVVCVVCSMPADFAGQKERALPRVSSLAGALTRWGRIGGRRDSQLDRARLLDGCGAQESSIVYVANINYHQR